MSGYVCGTCESTTIVAVARYGADPVMSPLRWELQCENGHAVQPSVGTVIEWTADPVPVPDDVKEAMDAAGKLAGLCHAMCFRNGGGPQSDFDWGEFAVLIHGIQARLLAQVAARAYPDQFRQLGGVIG